MKKPSFIYFIALVTILYSCAEIEGENIDKITTKKVINVDNLVVSPFQYSTYFNKVDYIPLQAINESFIRYVHNINTYKHLLFILDISRAKSLFIFNKNGKFISAIGEHDKDKREFYKIVDFSIEPEAEEIYILDQIGKINIFSLDGKFIREVLISGPTAHMYNNIEIVGNSIFLDIRYPQPQPNEKNYLLREVTLEGKFKRDWLDMNIINKGGGKSGYSIIMKSLYATSGGVFYAKEFMDVIYKIEENNVRPAKAVESQFKITNRDISNMDPSDNFYARAGKIDKIFSLSKITTGDNFSYFSYRKGGAQFSVVEKDHVTTLHQFWIDDVTYPSKSFHVQPPDFFTTSSDGKTLIGLTNGKKNWQKGIIMANHHLGGINPSIDAFFEQKFEYANNPILILYQLK